MIRSGRQAAVWVSILAVLLVACASPTYKPGQGVEDAEQLEGPPQRIRLEWVGAAEDQIRAVNDAVLELKLDNLTDKVLDLDLLVRADDGGQTRERYALGGIRLDPAAVQVVAVDLRKLPFDVRDLQFSGSAQVTARVYMPGLEPYELAVSPPVFYHPTADGGLLAYSERVLRERFSHGDYRGVIDRELLRQPGTFLDRVMYGGAGEVTTQPPEPGDDE